MSINEMRTLRGRTATLELSGLSRSICKVNMMPYRVGRRTRSGHLMQVTGGHPAVYAAGSELHCAAIP